MKILFFGDVVGKNGRDAIGKYIHKLVNDYKADFVIANCENASHGKGLTFSHYKYFCDIGIDAITLGNHYFNKVDIAKYIDSADKLVRPLNVKTSIGGVGSKVFVKNGIKIRVTNILGQAFMNEEVDSPFEKINELFKEERCIHIIDFHGESTSEKQIFGYYVDGKCSALIGTHTHVQTNDASILKEGTAFICDVGMCGQNNGVIGFDKDSVINKIVYGCKEPFTIDDFDLSQINAVLLDIDESNYKCREIKQINLKESAK